MAFRAGDPARPDVVTAVVLHRVDPGTWPRYEQWLGRLISLAATFRGHRGVDVIRPAEGSHTCTVAIRFDDLACACAWFASPARQALFEEVTPLLAQAERINSVTGLELWFDQPGSLTSPRSCKQFLLMLSVLHPLTLLVPPAVHAVAGGLPLLQAHWVAHLIESAVIAALLTCVVMPRWSRRLVQWIRR